MSNENNEYVRDKKKILVKKIILIIIRVLEL